MTGFLHPTRFNVVTHAVVTGYLHHPAGRHS